VSPFLFASTRRPNPSIHHVNSAIELTLRPLGPKPLRARQPSVSLFIVIITKANGCDRIALPALSKAPRLSPQEVKSDALS
jgi:hypothetical protein